MPHYSPDTGGSLFVSDADGNKRVEAGQLTDADGEPTGDYGITVTSSDGETVIIDGTSDMWRIAASGTMDFPAVGAGIGVEIDTVNVATGFTYRPVHFSFFETSGGAKLTPWAIGVGTGSVLWADASVINVDETRIRHSHNDDDPLLPGQTAAPARWYILEQVSI